jgi:UDP-N-acetylmuramate dehydrogenase
MNIQQNIPLSQHSTMRLGGAAAYYTEVNDRHELTEVLGWADQYKLPVIMIGSGSNIIWKDEGFPGLVIVNKIMGFEEQFEDQENYYVTVGAGENWDSVVARVVDKGMTGIEGLSLIPGTAGATPIQNVGAYGQEISNTLMSVQAYDTQTKQLVNIQGSDCGFSYRNSRFKSTDRGRFFITSITLHLMHANPQPPFYKALQGYFDEHQITNPTPQIVRDAVIAIRQAKLPDPAQVANNGSFFANPIIDAGQYAQLQADHPGIPGWPMDDGNIKIPAAWLMEDAGFKGIHDEETGMAIWPVHSLVLVNEKAQSTAQLLQFRQKILDKIKQQYDITLEQEPELLP